MKVRSGTSANEERAQLEGVEKGGGAINTVRDVRNWELHVREKCEGLAENNLRPSYFHGGDWAQLFRRTTKTSKKEMNIAVREARAVQPCIAKSQAQRTRRASRIRPRPASAPSTASSRSAAAMSDITGGRSNTKRSVGSRGERSRHAAAAAKKVLPPRYRQYDTPFDVEPWHSKPPVAEEPTACIKVPFTLTITTDFDQPMDHESGLMSRLRATAKTAPSRMSKRGKSPTHVSRPWSAQRVRFVEKRTDDKQMDIKDDVKDKYFGEEGRRAFFSLYKTMFRHRSLFSDRAGTRSLAECMSSEGGGPGVVGRRDSGSDDEDEAMLDDGGGDDRELLTKIISSDGEMSPRTRFIRHLAVESHSMIPLPIVVRRVMQPELDLTDMNLGDEFLLLLAEIMHELPTVEHLNITGNRVTDDGLRDILAVLTNNGLAIKTLNVSRNKLSMLGAIVLQQYVENRSCPLEALILSGSDLDDHEIVPLMDALETNKRIRHLDLSYNLLGAKDKLRKGAGALLKGAGGQAVGRTIECNVTLTHLDISWNKLGPDSGVAIGDALMLNKTLTFLNCSYNPLGELGSQSIGRSLEFNKVLRHLDMSGTGVRNRGAAVTASSLYSNTTLHTLLLDGNPLGQEGGRALMRCLNHQMVDRNISIAGCVFGLDRNSHHFDPAFPQGVYNLNMSDHYDRYIAQELLRQANYRETCTFRSVAIVKQDALGKTHRTPLKLTRPQPLPSNQSIVFAPHERFRCSSQLTKETYVKLRQTLMPCWHVEGSDYDPWTVPQDNWLELDLRYMPWPASDLQLTIATGFKAISSLITRFSNEKSEVLKLVGMEMYFLCSQVQELVKVVTEGSEAVGDRDMLEAYKLLLPRVLDSNSVATLLYRELTTEQIRRLSLEMGHALTVICGSVCNHYHFDMSSESDRMTAWRLACLNAAERDYVRTHAPKAWDNKHGGTAQHLNWTGYRNEKFRGTLMPAGLDDEFFSKGLKDKAPGTLEFDYVSMPRAPVAAVPFGSHDLQTLLLELGLKKRLADVQTPKAWRLADAGKIVLAGVKPHASLAHLPSVVKGIQVRRNLTRSLIKADSMEQMITWFREHKLNIDEVWPSRDTELVLKDLTEGHVMFTTLDSEGKMQRDIQVVHVRLLHSTADRVLLYRASDNRSTSWHTFIRAKICPRVTNLASVQQAAHDAVMARLKAINPADEAKLAFVKRFSTDDGGNPFRPRGLEGVVTIVHSHYFDAYVSGLPDVSFRTSSATSTQLATKIDEVIADERLASIRIALNAAHEVEAPQPTSVSVPRATRSSDSPPGTSTASARPSGSPTRKGSRPSSPTLPSRGRARRRNQLVDVIAGGNADMLSMTSGEVMGRSTLRMKQDIDALSADMIKWRWVPAREAEGLPPQPQPAAKNILQLRLATSYRTLTCDQVAEIVRLLSDKPDLHGSFRSTFVVAVFNRITDTENLNVVLRELRQDEELFVHRRLGWLNTYNPCTPDRYFDLDLRKPDERRMAQILTKMAVHEFGSFQKPRFRRNFQMDFIPGWELPASWDVERYTGNLPPDVPHDGQLQVTFNTQWQGHTPNNKVRQWVLINRTLLAVPRPELEGRFKFIG